MTRKRYTNLLRSIVTKLATDMDTPFHHIEYRIDAKRMAISLRETYGNYSYAELFKIFEPLAHKYGIGGY